MYLISNSITFKKDPITLLNFRFTLKVYMFKILIMNLLQNNKTLFIYRVILI